MLALLSDFGLKLAAHVAPWLVRYFYKVDRLHAGVKIRIVDGDAGISIDCGELPRFRAWVRITNLTPFKLTVDRVYGDLYHGAKLAEFRNLDRQVVPTASEMEFGIEADLTSEHVRFIRRNLGQRFKTYLSVSAHMHSRLHDFEIVGREVHTKNIDLVNCAPMTTGSDAVSIAESK